jgi:hypothetical protein
MVRFDRTALALGPSMPVSERAMLASTRAFSIFERLEFTASVAERRLHKGSPPVVCGPKVAPFDAQTVLVVPDMIKRADRNPISKLLFAFFIISSLPNRYKITNLFHL